MWITEDRMDVDVTDRPFPPSQSAAAGPQCECPDFCLVQHDNDN